MRNLESAKLKRQEFGTDEETVVSKAIGHTDGDTVEQ